MKYSSAIVLRAEEWVKEHGLIDYGGGQLQDFCKHLGINDKTYRRWLKEQDEFRSAIDRAKEAYKKSLAHNLHETLSQVALGFEREETETEYRPNPQNPQQPTITKMKKRKVFYQPNVGAAIFLLTNLDPEHYQNRQKSDITLKGNDEKEMTLEEINAEIARLEKLETKE